MTISPGPPLSEYQPLPHGPAAVRLCRTDALILRQRVFIVIREPQKDYIAGRDETSTDPNMPRAGNYLRKLPFDAIKVKTLVTPNLDETNLENAHTPEAFVRPSARRPARGTHAPQAVPRPTPALE